MGAQDRRVFEAGVLGGVWGVREPVSVPVPAAAAHVNDGWVNGVAGPVIGGDGVEGGGGVVVRRCGWVWVGRGALTCGEGEQQAHGTTTLRLSARATSVDDDMLIPMRSVGAAVLVPMRVLSA